MLMLGDDKKIPMGGQLQSVPVQDAYLRLGTTYVTKVVSLQSCMRVDSKYIFNLNSLRNRLRSLPPEPTFIL